MTFTLTSIKFQNNKRLNRKSIAYWVLPPHFHRKLIWLPSPGGAVSTVQWEKFPIWQPTWHEPMRMDFRLRKVMHIFPVAGVFTV
jgi:hypothetical protein